MKIAKVVDYETDSGGQQTKTGKATISTTNTGAFFDMMSRSIYSDAFGSIAREVVSNCFDAHIEAGIDKAVVVGIEFAEDETFMTFEDFGVGLSPDRFENVYMNYLESTKNDTDDQIGGFGIGGKSPLSYTDIYYLRTRHEGIEYYYSIAKGVDSIPEWDLLYQKPTYHSNGTLVKFIIEGGYWSDDYRKFEKALKFQLRYFDNVYIKTFDINNDYVVYQFDTFNYRDDVDEKEMHIIVGKVCYPINWKILKRPEIRIPVGVKFNIGDIIVTPNREQIRYSDEMIAVINERINACLEEIKSLATFEFDDLQEYLDWSEKETKKIRTSKCIIPIYEGDYGKHKNGKTMRYPFKLKKAEYTPFKGTNIVIPKDPFFFLKRLGTIKEGSYSVNKLEYTENMWQLTAECNPYRVKEFKSIRIKNKYINEGVIIVKKKMHPKLFMQNIGLGQEGLTYQRQLMRVKPEITEEYNKTKLFRLYRKVMTDLFVKRSKHYENLQIPKEFVDNYNAEQRAKRPVKIDGEIAVLDFSIDTKTKVIKHFSDFKNMMLIYGANKDKDMLGAIHKIMEVRRSKIKVVAINQNEFKLMEASNMVSLDKLILGKNRVLREQLTAFAIYKTFSKLDLNFVKDYVPLVWKRYRELHEFVQKCTKGEHIRMLTDSKFVQELIESAQQENLLLEEWIQTTRELLAIQNDLSIFKELMEDGSLSLVQKVDIAKLLVIKGYSVDRFYFFKPNETEMKWIQEWERYSGYLGIIKDASTLNYDQQQFINRRSLKTQKLKWQQANFPILVSNKLVKTSMLQLSPVMM